MADITAKMVQELRAATGAGILDCKKALDDADGGILMLLSKSLRKKGLAKAAKKADRDAKEGTIGYYVHTNSKVASMVKLNCETDFVARTEQFLQLGQRHCNAYHCFSTTVCGPCQVAKRCGRQRKRDLSRTDGKQWQASSRG